MSYDLKEISTYDVEKLPVTRKINRYEEKCNFATLAEILKSKKRILVVGGSEFDQTGKIRNSLNEFTQKYNCVAICDTYTNAFSDNEKVMNPRALGDVITQDQIPYLAPDLIISFGAVYYSTIKYFMSSYAKKAEHWQIAIDGMINDGYHCLTKVFELSPEEFFTRRNQFSKEKNNNEYFGCWKKRLDMMHYQKIDFTNLSVIREFCAVLPDNALLHTTVLDSIRMSNYALMKPTVRCFANIGADGIDGALSTYLGQSVNEDGLVYLLIGDLSLMYDMNALLQKLPSNIRILVINNYAGAEFHKNFGLERIPTLNKYIAAGHNIQIANCCINSQFEYLAATDMEELQEQLCKFTQPSNRPVLLEVFTDADKDAKALKGYWRENHEEISGMKISTKARAKRIMKKILGKNAYKLAGIIKK